MPSGLRRIDKYPSHPASGFPGLIIVQTLARRPGTGFAGGPVEIKLPIPRLHSGSGQQFQLNWITSEIANPQFLDLPMPVRIRL